MTAESQIEEHREMIVQGHPNPITGREYDLLERLQPIQASIDLHRWAQIDAQELLILNTKLHIEGQMMLCGMHHGARRKPATDE